MLPEAFTKDVLRRDRHPQQKCSLYYSISCAKKQVGKGISLRVVHSSYEKEENALRHTGQNRTALALDIC